jgi:hypothetical protein
MPIRQCENQTSQITFRGEKIGSTILSGAEQQKAFRIFQENRPDTPQLTIFCARETDEDALDAASSLIHTYAAKKWSRFLFINKQDAPPFDPGEVQDLYLMMGLHDDDLDSTRAARLWFRSRLGVPLWLCLTSPDPVSWYREKLGLRPDFLFSIKSGKSSG